MLWIGQIRVRVRRRDHHHPRFGDQRHRRPRFTRTGRADDAHDRRVRRYLRPGCLTSLGAAQRVLPGQLQRMPQQFAPFVVYGDLHPPVVVRAQWGGCP